ncbi:MAG: hypothetical protein AMXMBFR33_63340 [Candidatus Xenobia bacterium]|jgi:hypothetical protein
MRGYSTEWVILLLCLVGLGYSLYAGWAAWGWRAVALELGLFALTALVLRRLDRPRA